MRWSFVLLAAAWLSFPTVASDDDPSGVGEACVQNFGTSEQGIAACEKFPQLYAFVTPVLESSGRVCARKYMEFYCKMSPVEYKHAIDRDGKEVCILDSDQPVLNMCATAPKSYLYIKLKP